MQLNVYTLEDWERFVTDMRCWKLEGVFWGSCLIPYGKTLILTGLGDDGHIFRYEKSWFVDNYPSLNGSRVREELTKIESEAMDFLNDLARDFDFVHGEWK